jgi:hypothetical protein
MNEHTNSGPLRRVGVMWKPKEGGRSLGSGSLTIGTQRQRFVVLRNERKAKGTDPDFVLMSSDDPEPDQYAERRPATQGRSRAPIDDRGDIPF